MDNIKRLLIELCFIREEEEGEEYFHNEYCSVHIDYMKKGETAIADSIGNTTHLPTNIYSIIGYLFTKQWVTCEQLNQAIKNTNE